MDNNVARVLKTMSVIFFIIGFISGIVLGNTPVEYGSGFNLGTAVEIWMASFITSVFVYAYGEIIAILHDIRDDTNNNQRILTRMNKFIFDNGSTHKENDKSVSNSTRVRGESDKSMTTIDTPVAAEDNESKEPFTWTCSRCGELNLSKKNQCKKCGNPKAETAE